MMCGLNSMKDESICFQAVREAGVLVEEDTLSTLPVEHYWLL